MIQRIQSAYLVLGALVLVVMLFFRSLWEGVTAGLYAWFVPAVFVLTGLAVVTAIWAIFLYGDRARQRRVVVGVQALTVLLLGVLVGGMYLSGELALLDTMETVGLSAPVAAYILFLLARRSIEKDIDLVRSMDRLRE